MRFFIQFFNWIKSFFYPVKVSATSTELSKMQSRQREVRRLKTFKFCGHSFLASSLHEAHIKLLKFAHRKGLQIANLNQPFLFLNKKNLNRKLKKYGYSIPC